MVSFAPRRVKCSTCAYDGKKGVAFNDACFADGDAFHEVVSENLF